MSETVTIPTRLLTVAEWDALGERGDVRNLELSEGVLIVIPQTVATTPAAGYRTSGIR